MYILYILRCADDTLYTGITNDLDARLAKHRQGQGAKYVRSRLPVECVYTESCPTRSAALKRELKVKALTRQEKLNLIDSQYEFAPQNLAYD